MSKANDEYFAALPTEDLIGELIGRVDSFYNWTLTSGRLARWRVAHDTYYGSRGRHDSSWINQGGEQGELMFIMSNEYRNLVQHLHVMTTQARPDAECIAANSDFVSQSQAILGDSLIETYFKEKKVERVMSQAMEMALIMDTAWVFPMWDPNLGDVVGVDPDTGQQIKNGDINAFAKTPLDVIIDWSLRDNPRNDWLIVRDSANKFDVAASNPEKRDKIIALTRDTRRDALFDFGDNDWQIPMESDQIDIYTFFHEKTEAMPDGRMTVFYYADSRLWTFDGPLPFESIPGVRVCPNEQMLSKFGYSNANDLLALQDVNDALMSAVTTNITAAGVNNLWIKKGNQISYEEIAKGMSVIESDDKPEMLILNQINPQVIEFMSVVRSRMEAFSGINAVSRGDVQREMSGAAMALIQSMAIQFNSGSQKAWTHLIEDVGSMIIKHLQAFAQEERLAIVAGKAKSYMARYFSSKDITKIDRVIVRQGNSLRNTTAGRLEMAKEFLTAGIVTTAEQYIMVMDTGRLDPMIEGPENELMTIRAENEALMSGSQVQVIWTDDPVKHMAGHKEMLANPATREDPELVMRVTEHMQQHVMTWMQTDPIKLQLLGFPPPPMMGPDGMLMAQQPPPMPNGPALQLPNPGGTDFAGAATPSEQIMSKPTPIGNLPRQPNMPTNPLSGESFDTQTGGLPNTQGVG